ncbi:hypothetical protein B0O80DRAFT_496403 [Mortierella sp. GBAus27b]|nr:hypothetical protein BGX31_009022 [Mortierella sp. GBA43]KAI8357657.1 hypothetical protein B0O80DRAFT_496403 [Mortierella sp. GBAus27b]
MIQQEPTTPIIRALVLPEIVLNIAPYLDAADVLACYSVSRLFRLLFEPFLWQDIRFGYSANVKLSQRSLARDFPMSDIAPETMEILRRAAPWIRSLSIRESYSFSSNRCDSSFSHQLGGLCSRLERIEFDGQAGMNDPWNKSGRWNSYSKIIQQNQGRLQSLSVRNWLRLWGDTDRTIEPPWDILIGCKDCLALRSLELNTCEIPDRYMAHFWQVLQRLETLHLHGVRMNLVSPLEHSTELDPTATSIPRTRLPRLRDLYLLSDDDVYNAAQLLERMVAQCPLLQRLHWFAGAQNPFPFREFSDMFSASVWPHLDSITLRWYTNRISDEEYHQLLTDPHRHSHHRPLRCLSIERHRISETMFDLYREHHFATLQEIDISETREYTKSWTIQVLTSCPSLQRFKTQVITAQGFLDSGSSWVCHKLLELSIMIDMAFQGDRAPYRRFTERELDQCRAVFKQLAVLKKLRVLDMGMRVDLWARNNAFDREYYLFKLVPLPMRLKAGLDELDGLSELKEVHFWSGIHSTYKKEVMWMVDHWRCLMSLHGSWLVHDEDSEYRDSGDFYSGKLKELLERENILTYASWRFKYLDGDIEEVGLEDCCGENE